LDLIAGISGLLKSYMLEKSQIFRLSQKSFIRYISQLASFLLFDHITNG